MSSMRKTVLSFLVAVLISAPALAQVNVKLNASASPASGQAGITGVSVTGSGFPSGTISPSAVTVTLTPSGGNAITTAATTVATVLGSTRIVGFVIPGQATPGVYAIAIAGQTTAGTKFQSSNSSSVTVNPPPSIASVTPNTGAQGQTVSVTITGQYTTFGIGASKANFGPGISVGGASAGTDGPITVSSATSATASLSIASDAALGARNVTVTTGSQVASLANGFAVTSGNHAPTAVPGGPYSATLPAAVQFNGGSSSDPDAGDTLSYSWNFGDGTAQGSGATPSHNYTAAGSYNGSLVVTDNHGASSASVGFIVTISNATPVAVAGGPYPATQANPVTLNGSSSYDPDPNSSIASYDWNFGDGTAHGSGSSPSHSYADPGTYNGTLIVTDNHGDASAPVAFTVTVSPANQGNPVAAPGGPYTVQLPAAVQFDGSHSSDPNSGATLTYDWDFGDGTPHGSGVNPTHTYATANTYNGTLTVTDSLGLSSTAVAFAVTVSPSAPPPVVAISSPQPLAVFNASGNPITVSGTIDNSNATVSVNGVAASVSDGTFTAAGIELREGQNVITVTATDSAGNIGTTSETVTLNTTPPQLGILAPTDGATLATSTTTVAGNVNEQVPGTINAKQVVVMVNGIAAAVSNRTFSAPNVPLVQGMNTITVVATDPAGNTSQAQIHVTYMGTIPVQKILKVSGETQTGAIGTTLPQPLVIEAVDSNGAPVPNQTVTFAVMKSDGMLTSNTQQGQQVTAVTDQNGQASVQFTLGSRVGVGNNQVSVTAPGFVGQALFCETSTVGTPAKILVEMGDAQTGITGNALPAPLVVEVFDAGGNPVSYVPVTFNVEQGGGNFGGNTTLQVSTDINGMASALLTLGQQEGINNNVVSATFSGNAGPAASFVASGHAGGPASITSITGLVEDDSNVPVPGAAITLEGTNYTAVSDQNGNFTISPAPVGTYLLKVDGHTSTRTDAVFPTLVYNITTIAGLNNTLGMPVCLPPLDPTSVQNYDPNSNTPVVVQMTGIPGYVFTVAPHSVFNPDGTPYSGPLSLSQVHADRVPMAPPHGSLPLIAGTLQPPGLHFNPPVSTQFPNTSGLAPGTVLDIYSYDHDQMEWISQGPARVSADGSVIQSDPGFGISKSGWHFPPPPPPPPKCASSCTTKDPCKTAKCVNGACVTKPANEGAKCEDGSSSGEQCGTNGKCKNGSCVFDTQEKDGTPCTPDSKCVMDAKCMGGQCKGKPVDTSSWKDNTSGGAQFNFPTDIVNTISGWVSTLTGTHIEFDQVNVQGKSQSKTCCKDDTGPITDGETEDSGSGQLVATLKDAPLGPGLPDIDKTIDLGITKVQIIIEVGLKWGVDLTFNGEFGSRMNQCEPDMDCHFAQIDSSLEPSIYGVGESIVCVDLFIVGQKCVGGGVKIGAKFPLSVGVRYNKPDCNSGLQGFFSAGPPTLFITGEVDLPSRFEFSFQYQPQVLMLTCSLPGGCTGKLF